MHIRKCLAEAQLLSLACTASRSHEIHAQRPQLKAAQHSLLTKALLIGIARKPVQLCALSCMTRHAVASQHAQYTVIGTLQTLLLP